MICSPIWRSMPRPGRPDTGSPSDAARWATAPAPRLASRWRASRRRRRSVAASRRLGRAGEVAGTTTAGDRLRGRRDGYRTSAGFACLFPRHRKRSPDVNRPAAPSAPPSGAESGLDRPWGLSCLARTGLQRRGAAHGSPPAERQRRIRGDDGWMGGVHRQADGATFGRDTELAADPSPLTHPDAPRARRTWWTCRPRPRRCAMPAPAA